MTREDDKVTGFHDVIPPGACRLPIPSRGSTTGRGESPRCGGNTSTSRTSERWVRSHPASNAKFSAGRTSCFVRRRLIEALSTDVVVFLTVRTDVVAVPVEKDGRLVTGSKHLGSHVLTTLPFCLLTHHILLVHFYQTSLKFCA